MLDKYFKAPLFWDYLLASIFSGAPFFFYLKSKIDLPEDNFIISMTSDLSNVALTLAGFILTLLTVLITFKSGSNVQEKPDETKKSVFELFFASGLYFLTIKHLKNCIKSLLLMATIGYSLKLCLSPSHYHLMYFFNIFSLVIIILTLWRSLLILTKILKLQKE
ncbi:MAG TPA: hypothetical protein VK177_21230 [Flavobacteriales bacterium]|nr:hypothetical protein [Flavobacteriales bacterium]